MSFTFSCYASIQLIRIDFYKEQDKEILFDIRNKSEQKPILFKVGYHYNKEDNSEAPFIISPSLIRLAPNEILH